MSIEAKFDALTAAIVGLTAAITAQTTGNAAPATKAPIIGADPAVIESAKKATAEREAANAAAAKKDAPASEPPKSLTYDDVKIPFLALVKKNRDLALATIKPFGLDNLKGAKPEQFADIKAALEKALA